MSSSKKQANPLNHLPGLIFLSLGLIILATSTLLPPAARLQEKKIQNQKLNHQLVTFEEDKVKYRNYLEAARRRDPLIIEELAFKRQKQIPRGATPLDKVNDPITFHPKIISTHSHRPTQPNSRYDAFQSNLNLSYKDKLTQPLTSEHIIINKNVAASRIVRIIESPLGKTILSLIGISCLALAFLFQGSTPPYQPADDAETEIEEEEEVN